MVGADRTQFLSSDNGEPSGTAGKPILGQINSFNLTNVVVIVVRYFGGIKLGTSGLIAAYREAAREALQAANIIECHEQTNITFTFPYLAMNDVMKTLKQPPIPGGTDLKILSQTFDNTCTIAISIRADHAQTLLTALTNISGLTLHDTDR
jgi:putative IMPACT (imprinted ancient) family translation regulator